MVTKNIISDYEIEKGRKVLENHLVYPLTKEGAFESGLWCISSQATPWEMASNIIYKLRENSYPGDPHAKKKISRMETLKDVGEVNKSAKEAGWRFAKGNRFNDFINYFSKEEISSKDWHYEVRDANNEYRKQIVKDVGWLGLKTFSFWNICLGGKDFLALDVWILKDLKKLGLDIKEEYVVAQSRNVGKQKVRKTPREKEYCKVENEARELFSKDKRFLQEDGKVDLALVDSVLWWRGANRGTLYQQSLFEEEVLLEMPYQNMRRTGFEPA